MRWKWKKLIVGRSSDDWIDGEDADADEKIHFGRRKICSYRAHCHFEFRPALS